MEDKDKHAKKVGRPSAVTAAAISKLEEAFAMGCTDPEACLYAGISIHSLYRYQAEHPDFATRKHELKETPVLKARKRVVDEISNDTKAAQWYLERKRSDEFGPKQTLDVNHIHRLDDAQLLATFSTLLQLVGQHDTSYSIDAEYTEQALLPGVSAII